MKHRGVKRMDCNCCPGHDKFPNETYNNRRSKKKKKITDRLSNKRARLWDKQLIRDELKNID